MTDLATAESSADPPQTRRTRRSRRNGLSPAAVLITTAVWIMLWDRITGLVVVSGLLLSVAVALVFPLPRIELHGRFRPIALLRVGGRLLVDLVRSSVSVLVLAFRFGHVPRGAIIRVQLRSRSDLYLTQIAELVSLVPGTIVVETRRSTSTLYVHVLDTVSAAELDRTRQDVLDVEARVVRAFGDTAEIAAITNGTPWPTGHPARDTGSGPDDPEADDVPQSNEETP